MGGADFQLRRRSTDGFKAKGRSYTRTNDRLVKLSIVMPAYNEARTIRYALDRLLAVELPCETEIIVVDDGSTDGTSAVLYQIDDPRVLPVSNAHNSGKGVAVRYGASFATGTHLLVFDADLEYTPTDIPALLDPVISGRADVVYGTRLMGVNTTYQSYKYAWGNRVMTMFANILFDSYISDLHTCLKLVPLPLFRSLDLTENSFGFDTQMTAELLRRGLRPFEVPISYRSRSKAEGKKIDWKDGVRCLMVLTKTRIRHRTITEPGMEVIDHMIVKPPDDFPNDFTEVAS